MPGETDVIQHKIKLTDDTPIRCKSYPLPYAVREELQNEVDRMLEMGVRPSTSPYVLPIVMVKKKDGSNRVCVDFLKLNKITVVDPKPMTTAEDLFRRLARSTCRRLIFPKDIGRYLWHQKTCTRQLS